MFMFSERSIEFHHSAERTVGGESPPVCCRRIGRLDGRDFAPARAGEMVGNLRRNLRGAVQEVVSARPAGAEAKAPAARYVGAVAMVCAFASSWSRWPTRGTLVERSPALAGIYRAVGAPVSRNGIAVEGVKARLGGAGGGNLLLVEGSIVNRRATQVFAPDLRIALRDGNGEERYVWISRVGQTRLAPAERVKFSARLEAPPAGVVDATVKIAGAGERSASSSEGL